MNMKNPENEIRKLLKSRRQIEAQLKELDRRITHVQFILSEERRCMLRKCPLEDEQDPPQ